MARKRNQAKYSVLKRKHTHAHNNLSLTLSLFPTKIAPLSLSPPKLHPSHSPHQNYTSLTPSYSLTLPTKSASLISQHSHHTISILGIKGMKNKVSTRNRLKKRKKQEEVKKKKKKIIVVIIMNIVTKHYNSILPHVID
jgi:hypothetical protein